MSEIEQMLAKPKADVEAITVQFGLFSAEEAAKKTKEELVSALSGVPVEELVPKKPAKTAKAPAKKTPAKKAKAETSDAAPEKEEKAEKPVKKTTKTTKATKKVAEVKEAEVKEEAAAPEAPVEETKAPSKAKKPAVRKSKKATAETKTEESAPVVAEEKVATEKTSEEAKPAKKTTSKKKPATKKTKTEVKDETLAEETAVETSATEVPSGEETPAEEKPQAKKTTRKSAAKKKTSKASETKTEEAPSEETVVEEKPADEQPKADNKKVKGKKRRISFGPEQEMKQVEIPAADSAETAPAEEVPPQPVVPEIQYIEVEGILSISGENKGDFCGFVHRNNYLPGEEDAYVPGQMIRRLGLRRGDKIKGLAVPAKGKDKYSPLKKVLSVNDVEIPEDSDFEIIRKRKRFEQLTAIYPNERLTLETGAEDLSCRIIDLFSPIGKGQRGMIVSPPKAGKTILLQKVANAITANNPKCKVIVLLIDERPEEVTDMQRSIKGEVVYSTFDKRPENHVRVTELVLERAMRLVELDEDVVILLDSMTRLARAYNLTINPTGRTLSGGLDPGSLYGPKRFFGAARNIENGGSLTIISTALVETGSRMDEVIFEEFKGTGNMEVVLDRKLADRRVYPAIAVEKSGTRREDLLLTPEELESVWLTRKVIADVDTIAAAEAVINFMKRTSSNNSFVLSAKKSFGTDS